MPATNQISRLRFPTICVNTVFGIASSSQIKQLFGFLVVMSAYQVYKRI